ncbi:unnamed protein product [Angiostrongylus costaricensis]|uniref:RRM domain-containing protein n=1 Tax=Angiostrongylus costaricensis TaxID=334426 RepID=A0A0R3PLM6_ANGCS|nr:unnamed protein product [Angiostrongylus costaricensis]
MRRTRKRIGSRVATRGRSREVVPIQVLVREVVVLADQEAEVEGVSGVDLAALGRVRVPTRLYRQVAAASSTAESTFLISRLRFRKGILRRRLSKKFGKVVDIWLASYHPFYAFITYKRDEDAEEAIRKMNDSCVFIYFIIIVFIRTHYIFVVNESALPMPCLEENVLVSGHPSVGHTVVEDTEGHTEGGEFFN